MGFRLLWATSGLCPGSFLYMTYTSELVSLLDSYAALAQLHVKFYVDDCPGSVALHSLCRHSDYSSHELHNDGPRGVGVV